MYSVALRVDALLVAWFGSFTFKKLLRCCYPLAAMGMMEESLRGRRISGARQAATTAPSACTARLSSSFQKSFPVASFTACSGAESLQMGIRKVNFKKCQLALFTITLDPIQIVALNGFLLLLFK